MKIAIVGSGIAGLVAAHRLHPAHEITLYEAGSWIGGHTHTVEVRHHGECQWVDTGFIVHNRRNYPRFCALLEEWGVATQASDMSFSVRDESRDFEYCGTSLNSLFAQRRNLLNPSFHRMLLDILRFHREAPRLVRPGLSSGSASDETLGRYLARNGYGHEFIHEYLVPMGSAIWSAEEGTMEKFPIEYFVRFFLNHGLLSVRDRPQWRVLVGGSIRYVEAATRPFRDRIRLRSPVDCVRRTEHGVEVSSLGTTERYDRVVIAAHSDQALAMLADASLAEREVLGAIPYQPNEAVLHTDDSVLPKRRVAWASWNYHLGGDRSRPAAVTYLMNKLQSLPDETTYCVTLNRTERIDPSKIIETFRYHHPVYTPDTVAAQCRVGEISGVRNTHYCGAYWGFGFHEDGVNSALRVVDEIAASERGPT